MMGFRPDEIADQRSAPNEENQFLLPDRFPKSKLLERTSQPFDLMSRRHPLSSTRAARLKTACEKRDVLKARVTCRHQAAGNFLSEGYFFFLETFLVFFAVFFTALFAFFAFLAFLAMLPS
jgi:hypothetical protein